MYSGEPAKSGKKGDYVFWGGWILVVFGALGVLAVSLRESLLFPNTGLSLSFGVLSLLGIPIGLTCLELVLSAAQGRKKGAYLVWIGGSSGVLGVLVGSAPELVPLSFVERLSYSDATLFLWFSYWSWLLGLLLFLTGGVCMIRGRRLRQLSADEALASSKKPAILYLRPFSEDEKIVGRIWLMLPLEMRIISRLAGTREIAPGMTYETQVWMVLKKVGPFVAIGKPDDEHSPIGATLGAARLYVSNEEWQKRVNELVSDAGLVLWVLGHSDGIRWELARLIEVVPPEKLIICLPFIGMRPAARQTEWESFSSHFRSMFPKPLPANVGRALFMRFDADWMPQLVRPKPVFLDRFGFLWPRIRRALQCALDEMFIEYGAKTRWLRDSLDVLFTSVNWIIFVAPIVLLGVLAYMEGLALIPLVLLILPSWRLVVVFRSLR